MGLPLSVWLRPKVRPWKWNRLCLVFADVVIGAVCNRRVGTGKGSVADAVAVGGHGHVEGFVRSLGVVVGPKAVKGVLGVGSIAEGGIAQQVGLQGAVPFGLAGHDRRGCRLASARPTASTASRAVGRTKASRCRLTTIGQSIAGKQLDQLGLHGLAGLVGTRLQAQRIARVVRLRPSRNTPSGNRSGLLKSICHNRLGASASNRRQAAGAAGASADSPLPPENSGDRTGTWHALQIVVDFTANVG